MSSLTREDEPEEDDQTLDPDELDPDVVEFIDNAYRELDVLEALSKRPLTSEERRRLPWGWRMGFQARPPFVGCMSSRTASLRTWTLLLTARRT